MNESNALQCEETVIIVDEGLFVFVFLLLLLRVGDDVVVWWWRIWPPK